MWLKFVTHPAIFSRPFMDFSQFWNVHQLIFYSDASHNFDLGFGSYCQESWMQQKWGKEVAKLEPSIQYLELYALTAAFLAWGHCFSNKRIIIFTDNNAVVSMVNKTSSSCKNCMVLIRLIVLHSLIHNVRMFARFVSTKQNGITDALSRLQETHFQRLMANLNFDQSPTPVPEEV